MPLLRGGVRGFWRWYQRHYLAVLVVTTGVFLLQLFHLYWLFTDVVLQRLTGTSFFAQGAVARVVGLSSLFADYLEIPTLISASLLYVNELRRGLNRSTWKAAGFLFLLNTQWLHIFWITDEVVVEYFAGPVAPEWNVVLAWVAILIDFLELPVIYDTLRRVWSERDEIAARVRRRFQPSETRPDVTWSPAPSPDSPPVTAS
jgi:hypothetical protein